MSIDDIRRWADMPLQPTRILMHRDDYRDIAAWGLMEEGMSETAAYREADRRIEEMEREAEERGEEELRRLVEALGGAGPTPGE